MKTQSTEWEKIFADYLFDKGFIVNIWFKIGKGVHQGCMLSPCLFNLYAEDIM